MTEAILEGAQTWEILVKDVKSIVLNMFSELKETIDRKSKRNQKKWYINKMRLSTKR